MRALYRAEQERDGTGLAAQFDTEYVTKTQTRPGMAPQTQHTVAGFTQYRPGLGVFQQIHDLGALEIVGTARQGVVTHAQVVVGAAALRLHRAGDTVAR